jgi:hypothetical protein
MTSGILVAMNSSQGGHTPHEPGHENLDAIRERLYARGALDPNLGHTDLSAKPQTPLRVPEPTPIWRPVTAPPKVHTPFNHELESPGAMNTRMRRRTRIRMLLLGGGAVFFLVAAVLASTYIFFGKNTISGENITLEARGPFAVGGGEKFDFSIALRNQNAVPIESATINIDYPQGTQSASEEGKLLYRDHKTIDRIGSGEVMNIPASAIVFGEENDEKEIKVTIDYRVQGSNATFFREALPLKFKVSSSPVTMVVDTVKNVTSGQEVEFKVTLTSNSPTPLEDLLLKAEYPGGFSFSSSEPRPVAGEDTWRIQVLKPKEKKTVVVRGLMSGKDTEQKVFKLSAGVSSDKDPYQLSSVLTTKSQEIGLEAAFVNLSMTINSKNSDIVVVGPNENAAVEMTFRNTLADTIYDAVVEVVLEGNALDESSVGAGAGFYDSSRNTIRWDAVDNSGLKEIPPGKSQSMSFSFKPLNSEQGVRTPQIKATVNVKGKRVSESKAAESLTGTLSRTVKVDTTTALTAQTFHSTGPFKNDGPLPPVIEKPTTYTIIMALENSTNPLSDAVVEAVLPQYVSWADDTQAAQGTVTYNASSRTVTWRVGDVDVGKTIGAAYKVSIKPSVSQVGTIPALVLEQRSRAKDRFTGSTIRSSSANLTTTLADETDETKQEGRVRQTE